MKLANQNLIGALTILKNENIKQNFSELERVYGISRKTIRKYYHQGGLPEKQAHLRGSAFNRFKNEIIHKISIPGITFKAAFEHLRKNTLTSKRSIV